jgi:hypothetical protein
MGMMEKDEKVAKTTEIHERRRGGDAPDDPAIRTCYSKLLLWH